MARVLGRNSAGAYVVETDDGREVTTPTLPPGLEEPPAEPWAAAYAPPEPVPQPVPPTERASRPAVRVRSSVDGSVAWMGAEEAEASGADILSPEEAEAALAREEAPLEKAVWIRSAVDGTPVQASAQDARAWNADAIPEEEARAEREHADAKPAAYVRADGVLRPLSAVDAELARSRGLDVVSPDEAKKEVGAVWFRDYDGRIGQTNAAMAKQWKLEVLSDDEGERLFQQQEEEANSSGLFWGSDGTPVSMNAGEARRLGRTPLTEVEAESYYAEDEEPAGPANPLRNPAAYFAQHIVTQATPAQPTGEELAKLRDFASQPPPAAPAPGAPEAFATSMGVPPAPSSDRTKEFTGFRGDPAVQVRAGDGWSAAGGTTPEPAPAVDGDNVAVVPDIRSYFSAPSPQASAGLAAAASAPPALRPMGLPDLGQKDAAAARVSTEQAIAAREAHEVVKARGIAAFTRETMAQQDKLAAELAQEEEARRLAVEDGMRRLDELTAEANKPAGRVDANRWWASKSTPGRVMAVIAHTLMNAGAALQGRPPINFIRDLIDEDIERQEKELDRAERTKDKAVSNQRYLLEQTRQVYGERVAAKLAAQATAWTQYERRLGAMAAEYGESEAGVRAKEMLAQVAQMTAEKKQQLGLHLAQLNLASRADARAQAEFDRAQRTSLQGGAVSVALAAGEAVPLDMLTPDQRKLAIQVAPGRVVLALDAEAAKELREKQAATTQVLGFIDRLSALRREYGGETLPSDAKETLKSLLAELKTVSNKARGLGALDNGTLEVLGQIYGDDATTHWPSFEAKLRSGRQSAVDGYNSSFLTFTGRAPGVPMRRQGQ